MFKRLCALRVTETKFYVCNHGTRKYSEGPIFLKSIKQIFCDQNEENISRHVTKLIIWVMQFVNRKNRKLRPNLLSTLRTKFSKIRARYQRYLLDAFVNVPDICRYTGNSIRLGVNCWCKKIKFCYWF